MLLILGGGGIAAYTVTASVDFLVSGQWRAQWDARRRRKMLDYADQPRHRLRVRPRRKVRGAGSEIRGCSLRHPGEGRRTHGANPAVSDTWPSREMPRTKELLEQAGIRRARGLVAAVDTDAENVYITLTARGMNPDLNIIARANFEELESKLLRAGANRVLLPYSISGRRMVTMLLHPEIADFLEEVAHAGGMELLLEQVKVAKASKLAGSDFRGGEIPAAVECLGPGVQGSGVRGQPAAREPKPVSSRACKSSPSARATIFGC